MANRGSEEKVEKVGKTGEHVPRSKLHNFTFLTSAWGVQRVMRGSRGSRSPAEPSEKHLKGKSPVGSVGKDKEMIREVETKNPQRDEDEERKEEEEEKEKEDEIPWNLRKRRAYGKGDSSGANGGIVAENGTGKEEGKKRKPFSLSLSREEIEADFLVMKGKKPPRRPKKRPKHVQRQVDMMFPGMWLDEVTPDLYKVKEV